MQHMAQKPGERFTWNEGDLEFLKPGEGEPLISQEEMARILSENEPDALADAKRAYFSFFETEPPAGATPEQMIAAIDAGRPMTQDRRAKSRPKVTIHRSR
jgi:hypothetical protein